MIITSTSEIQLEPVEKTEKDILAWETVRYELYQQLSPEFLEARYFVLDSPFVYIFPKLTAYAEKSFSKNRPILEAVADLMRRIYEDFTFVSGATTIATPISEVLEKRQGVCQDFAHLMIGCVRSQGLPARYVSGYIETIPPPGQEKLAGTDASHAWCSVYVPEIGWVDFDPTNNLMPKDQHIVIGWGCDFSDVTPIKGVLFNTGRHKLKVSVDVVRS
jgi:transglutaminase-like putative cysteine protease